MRLKSTPSTMLIALLLDSCAGVLPELFNRIPYYYNGYFKAKKWKGEPKIGEPNKNEEIKWFDIHNIPDNLVDDRKEAIKNYIEKIPYGEFGWEERNLK